MFSKAYKSPVLNPSFDFIVATILSKLVLITSVSGINMDLIPSRMVVPKSFIAFHTLVIALTTLSNR